MFTEASSSPGCHWTARTPLTLTGTFLRRQSQGAGQPGPGAPNFGPLPWTWLQTVAVTIVLVFGAALMVCLSGCNTCRPACCADCPPVIELVDRPPEVIIIPPPKVNVPDRPRLESIEQWALAAIDPAAWLRLLVADMVETLDALDRSREELAAVNDSAPPSGGSTTDNPE